VAELIKLAEARGPLRANAIFIHGLGGNPLRTWWSPPPDNKASPKWLQRIGPKRDREPPKDEIWPTWLTDEIEGLSVWTIGYDAAVSNWSGSAMYLIDRAAHVFELILANRDLQQGQIIFVGHSLGGLVIKELLRKASDEAQSRGRDTAGKLSDNIKSNVLI
jgi:pimeloyl-ACP methyl ester carboxylesterase